MRAAGGIKSFLIQQFFKNVGEVQGEQPTFAEQITKLNNEIKQKSRSKSKESQLPLKSRGCNEITGFQGQLRFPGKLGMCPSLAEPDSNGIPRTLFHMKHDKNDS